MKKYVTIVRSVVLIGVVFITAFLFFMTQVNALDSVPNASNYAPVGWLDIANCDTISGWALDKDTPNDSIAVHIYKDGAAGAGGIYVGSYTANLLRSDINKVMGVTGNHAFSIVTPQELKDGRKHKIYVHGIDSSGRGGNVLLSGVPKTIKCGSGSMQRNVIFGTFMKNKLFREPFQSSGISAQYFSKFKEIFGGATIGGHFFQLHSQGRYTYKWNHVDGKVDILEDLGVKKKLHALIWDSANPALRASEWYQELSSSEKKKALEEHVRTVVRHYKGRIDIYDVANHPIKEQWSGAGNYMGIGPRNRVIADVLRWAREEDPNAILILNEGTVISNSDVRRRYIAMVNDLITNKGAPLDGLGVMAHLGQTSHKLPSDSVIINALNELATTGLRIHITEFDLSYANMDGSVDIDPDQPFEGFSSWWEYQAWAYRHAYELFASHPSVDMVSSWGMWDGSIWRAGAGIFDENFNKKPVYYSLEPILRSVLPTPVPTPTPTLLPPVPPTPLPPSPTPTLLPPVPPTPPPPAPSEDLYDSTGWLDAANCDIIGGWAADKDTLDIPISVHIYEGGPAGSGNFVTGTVANGDRPDVGNHLKSQTSKYGFAIATPQELKDGRKHAIYVHGIDSSGKGRNLLLSGTPKTLACGTAVSDDEPGLSAPSATPTPNRERLRSTCTYEGGKTFANLSWDPVDGADSYHLRVNYTSNDSSSCTDRWYCPNSQDRLVDNMKGTSYRTEVTPGKYYSWWIHGLSDFREIGEPMGASFMCSSNMQSSLQKGTYGDEVTKLQEILAGDKEVYPEGLVTGFFGPLTLKAVKKFQEKYSGDILAPLNLNAATGFVGSSTLKKLNELMGF